MSNYRTQCPNCQASYPLPTAKLGDPKARAKCGRCQQVFYVNENLIGEPVVQPTPSVAPQPSASSQPAPAPVAPQPVAPVVATTTTAAGGMDSFEAMLAQMPKKSSDATPNAGFIPADNMPTTSYQDTGEFSELDNFLNQDVSIATTTIHSAHQPNNSMHNDA